LVGTNWGCNLDTVRTTSLALVPINIQSGQYIVIDDRHYKINRTTMILSKISSPKLRREAALFQELKYCWVYGKSLPFPSIKTTGFLMKRHEWVTHVLSQKFESGTL